jgi:hypothetical protein
MSGYLSFTGKLFAVGAVAYIVGKALGRRGEDSRDKRERRLRHRPGHLTLGLPLPLYDELCKAAFAGDKGAFTSALDREAAPIDADFRSELWYLLGGE